MILPFIVTILIGLGSGIVLATPPGVINLMILHYLAQGKPRKALWVGAGSAALDIFYGALAMYSASAVYAALAGFISTNPITMKTLEGLLIAAMIGFALYKLFFESHETPPVGPLAPLVSTRELHPFYLGCALGLTHIVVPTFLPGYAYLATILINSKIIPETNLYYWLISVAFGVGNFLWVVGVVRYFRNSNPIEDKLRFRRIDLTIGVLFLTIGSIGAARLLWSSF
jgi:hypothetical protein